MWLCRQYEQGSQLIAPGKDSLQDKESDVSLAWQAMLLEVCQYRDIEKLHKKLDQDKKVMSLLCGWLMWVAVAK
jgi:hypothetical protein